MVSVTLTSNQLYTSTCMILSLHNLLSFIAVHTNPIVPTSKVVIPTSIVPMYLNSTQEMPSISPTVTNSIHACELYFKVRHGINVCEHASCAAFILSFLNQLYHLFNKPIIVKARQTACMIRVSNEKIRLPQIQ